MPATRCIPIFIALALALSLATGPAALKARGASGGPALETVLARMDQNGSAVTSGRLLLRGEEIAFLDAGPKTVETSELELWFDGVRVRVERRTTREGGESEVFWTVFDGERVIEGPAPDFPWAQQGVPMELSDLGKYVTIGGFNVLMQWPLEPAVLHARPMGELVQSWSSEPPQAFQEEPSGDLACYLIQLAPKALDLGGSSTWSLWVAPEKGYALARFQQENVLPGTGSVSRTRLVDQVDEWMHPLDGLWLPKAATQSRFFEDRSTGVEKLVGQRKAEVTSAVFNISVPDEVFRLALPEHTRVVPFDEEVPPGGRRS